MFYQGWGISSWDNFLCVAIFNHILKFHTPMQTLCDSILNDSNQLDSVYGDLRTWSTPDSRLGNLRTRLKLKFNDSTWWLKLCDSSHCDWINFFKMTRKNYFIPYVLNTLLHPSQLKLPYTFILLTALCSMAVVKIHVV